VKRFFRLGLFAIVVALILGCFYGEARFFISGAIRQGLIDYRKLQKAQVALAIVSFHSYYHKWPGHPGSLDESCLAELSGFEDAKINTQHIDFFEKNGSDGNLLDSHGNALYFKTDESIGTCTVYENAK
jgi:hypothetical protein